METNKQKTKAGNKNKKTICLFVLVVICIVCVALACKSDDIAKIIASFKKTDSDKPTMEIKEETTTETQIETETENETESRLDEILKKNSQPSSYSIDVDAILQTPELPTGCEITSLATVLNYWGYDADKCDLADNYLRTESSGGEYTIYEAFLGSPYDNSAFGCYSPVIEASAKKYLNRQSEKMEVKDITGTTIQRLYNCISEGYPVIVWATMWLHDPVWVTYWTNEDGTVFEFPNYEHCMVLTGYNKNNNTVEVCDPLEGNTTYEMDRFEEIYAEMGRQAVLLYD